MLRIAAIEFLNAAPLMWGLERDARFSLEHTLPSVCADRLRDGSADLGVIPVIELARIPALTGLDGIGVASCDGEGEAAEVRSILLISRCLLPQVQTLALDRASRTSAALAQILLRQRFGASFSVDAGDANWQSALQRADAVLLIGDPALRLRISGGAAEYEVHDLACLWREWTGLPFVFALWGMRAGVYAANRSWLEPRLRQALSEALGERQTLIADWSQRLHLPAAEVAAYLEHNVAHTLTPRHHEGMRRFFQLAAEAGLIAGPELPQLAGAAAL
ncbi:MAG: menaquinone biosynthetic enzyme MqnA/MqnD family protein [Terriglobales bacterium]